MRCIVAEVSCAWVVVWCGGLVGGVVCNLLKNKNRTFVCRVIGWGKCLVFFMHKNAFFFPGAFGVTAAMYLCCVCVCV